MDYDVVSRVRDRLPGRRPRPAPDRPAQKRPSAEARGRAGAGLGGAFLEAHGTSQLLMAGLITYLQPEQPT